MYGLLLECLESMITRTFGEHVWDKVKHEAKIEIKGFFDSNAIYDDSLMMDILATTESVLNIKSNELMEMFGRVFYEHCEALSYTTMLKVLGSDLKEFFQRLDNFHDQLKIKFPGLRMPMVRCSERIDGTLVLHYYSQREGLEHFMLGIVKTVCSKLTGQQTNVEIIKYKGSDCDHVQYQITNRKTQISNIGISKNFSVLELISTNKNSKKDMIFEQVLSFENKISPFSFSKIFPFHLVFDKNLVLRQAGITVAKSLPSFTEAECKAQDVFELLQPNSIEFTFTGILSHINTPFMMRIKNPPYDEERHEFLARLKLKGQMVYVPENDMLLFLCSPLILNIDDLRAKNLTLNDIPIHDATKSLILNTEQFEAECKMAKNFDLFNDKLQQTYCELEDEKAKTDRLLYSVLPPSVAYELRQQRPVPAKRYESVTLLSSSIVGFADYCARNSDSNGTINIVKLLNNLYTTFDVLTDKKRNPNVFKVETIKDQYMVVSGLPEPCESHARSIAHLALDMIDSVKRVYTSERESIKLTVGLHTGEIVTGIIGKRMPRYCLFGQMVNITSRTETTGLPGMINVSEPCYKVLMDNKNYDSEFKFTYRGLVQMKGRPEPMKTWLLTRSSTEQNLAGEKN